MSKFQKTTLIVAVVLFAIVGYFGFFSSTSYIYRVAISAIWDLETAKDSKAVLVDNNIELKTYTNTQFGFSFQYPLDSRPVTEQSHDSWGAYTIRLGKSLSGAGSVSGLISVVVNSSPMTTRGLYAECYTLPDDQHRGRGDISNMGTTTINGIDFFGYVQTFLTEPYEVKQVYSTMKDNKCYSITTLYQKKSETTAPSELELSAKSFRFTR